MARQKREREYELFTRETQAFIYNMQVDAIQRMLDFDRVVGREIPSVAAIVNTTGSESLQKFFFGPGEILVPVYTSLAAAARRHAKADVLISFASFRSASRSAEEAFELKQIRTIVLIAEGIPERQTKKLIARADKLGKVIIGPATVGGIRAGAFKIGNTGGTLENIIEAKLHRPGSVGFVSKSGGLSNEAYNIIARNTDGLYEGIAIGGDRFPGSTLLDHLLRYEKNPAVKMLVCLGEVGGTDEYEIVDALKKKKIKKPLVVWVTGTCAKAFKTDIQFGHAGARAGIDVEGADAKNAALRAAGAVVPGSFDDYAEKIRRTYERLVTEGKIRPAPEAAVPTVPAEFDTALKAGMIRRPASFISTISDERGKELLYGDMPISRAFRKDIGIGGVISLLWFKKLLPRYATKFIEMVLMTVADHGPAGSGAHNTIVTTRAGKDLISSLVSGLLCIGPRFGGALDGAALQFSDALDRGLTPREFVDSMKQQGVNIQGIGDRVKSIHNPDMRVAIIKDYARKNLKDTTLLDYALKVEKITTSKRDSLILNVDGCIAACFVDLLRSEFSRKEADDYIRMGSLNGLFVLGRSIGFIGHHLDQMRLKQGLYRHPWEDIAYLKE
ncbi:MAG: ATP citrate synthase [Deltaproteobacteria bacterium]|nr:ATP citrate synthase [Deltaproteobacteria bacterium]